MKKTNIDWQQERLSDDLVTAIKGYAQESQDFSPFFPFDGGQTPTPRMQYCCDVLLREFLREVSNTREALAKEVAQEVFLGYRGSDPRPLILSLLRVAREQKLPPSVMIEHTIENGKSFTKGFMFLGSEDSNERVEGLERRLRDIFVAGFSFPGQSLTFSPERYTVRPPDFIYNPPIFINDEPVYWLRYESWTCTGKGDRYRLALTDCKLYGKMFGSGCICFAGGVVKSVKDQTCSYKANVTSNVSYEKKVDPKEISAETITFTIRHLDASILLDHL
jgi:hypothetical protein